MQKRSKNVMSSYKGAGSQEVNVGFKIKIYSLPVRYSSLMHLVGFVHLGMVSLEVVVREHFWILQRVRTVKRVRDP